MNDEIAHSSKKLKQATQRLQEVAHKPPSDIIRDATIQRFEFTFELLWKTCRLFLKEKGVLANTPKDCFREAFRLGWIRDESAYLAMLEARNAMSHAYDEGEAREVYKQIKKKFLKPILSFLLDIESRAR